MNQNQNVFTRMLITDRIKVIPSLIGGDLGEVIKNIAIKKYEGHCSQYGYILAGSLQIYKYSMGQLISASLNGDVVFTVMFYANVCNPLNGTLVKVTVVNMNKFGILGEYTINDGHGKKTTVIEVVIARNAPSNSSAIASDADLSAVKIGDVLTVEIVNKKFELKDKKISAIGRVVNSTVTNGTKTKKHEEKPGKDAAADGLSDKDDEDTDEVDESESSEKSDDDEDEKSSVDDVDPEVEDIDDESESTEGESSEDEDVHDDVVDDDEDDDVVDDDDADTATDED